MATVYAGSVEILTGREATGKVCEFECPAKARYNVYDQSEGARYACKRHLSTAFERVIVVARLVTAGEVSDG